jgi:hypothetical protein
MVAIAGNYTQRSRKWRIWVSSTSWRSQSLRIRIANAANLRTLALPARAGVTQINPRKFANFAYSRYSRSKSATLSSDFEKACR